MSEKKGGIIAIIIIIIIAGIFGFIYFKNTDFIKKTTYSNLTISAKEGTKKVVTGYIIETENETIERNTTLSNELEKVKDGNIKIYNKNLQNQNYYIEIFEFNTSKETKRITFNLIKPKEIKIEKEGINPINITLTSEYTKNLDVCFDYSLAYIFLELENYTRTDDKDYRCYNTKFNLSNTEKEIKLSYKTFTTPDENDYINLVLKSRGLENETIQIVKIK